MRTQGIRGNTVTMNGAPVAGQEVIYVQHAEVLARLGTGLVINRFGVIHRARPRRARRPPTEGS